MNSGRGDEMQSEHAEAQLRSLEEELKSKIEEAKTISREMKTSLDNDDQNFTTNSNGVPTHLPQELIYPEFQN